MGNWAPVYPAPTPFPRQQHCSWMQPQTNPRREQGPSLLAGPFPPGRAMVLHGGNRSALALCRWMSGWVLVSRTVTTSVHTHNWTKKSTQLLRHNRILQALGYWFIVLAIGLQMLATRQVS